MEAGLGGGSDLSEARRVGRGSEAFSGSALLSPPRRHRASPPVAYPRRAGPSRAAARGPWPSDRAGTAAPRAMAHMGAVPFHVGFF